MSYDVNDFIQHFLDLDLTEREATTYVTLLSRNGYTANELQRAVHIPSTKIYDVLKKMIKRGICTERFLDGVKFYEAVNPEIAFQIVLDKYKIEIEQKTKVAEKLIQNLLPIFNENKDLENSLDFIEILKDNELLQKRYIKVWRECQKEVLVFVKGPYLASSNSSYKNEQEEAEINFLNRGGIVRGLYESGELHKLDFLMKSIPSYMEKGEQVKIAKSLPMKMMVFDEKMVMFPLTTNIINSSSLTTIFIEHPQLALTCKTLFEVMWEKSISYEEFLERSKRGIS
ncbi:MAG TPA: helix-turn-helix domain-containing protein [Ignavibacteria bacterium]